MHAVPPSAPPGIPRPGDVIGGRYAVQRIVERGPLSMTLLTHDSSRRSVAIVVLYPGKATQDTVARFVAEARTASQIESEHVARVYEVGALPDGAPFVAMEYVAGTDLAEMLSARGGPFPVAVATDVVLQAIDAVASARVHGVLHRDLRPASMLLVSRGDGSEILKVLDFDLSPVRDATAPPPNLFPLHRRPRGSHAYLAPERALDPGVVDLRADVWSLGAVLFFLVTGAPPYAEGTAAEVLGAIAARSPEALRVRLRDIPGPLADAILRCLEPDRDRRFSDVAELGEALVPYGTGARTAGARRAREALSRPPPSFLTTMPLQVIPAAPPPPAPSAPAEMPGFGHRTLAFTPTPQAMPIPVMPPHVMATLPFSVPAMAPAPPVARTSGPSGAMVAIVGGLLTVAIGGAIAGVLLSRPRDAVVMDPPPAETTSTSAASPPPLETAAAVPEPTEEPTAAPSSTPPAAVSAAAAAETPSTPITPVTPVTMPASRRPSKSELLRSRE